MRSVLAAAFLALSTFVPALIPGPAAAADSRLSAAEIRDIARREMLWCEEYDARTDDCDVVSLMRLAPDGSLTETSTILLQIDPRLQVYIADTDKLEGDRLCSKVEAARTQFTFTLDGTTLPQEVSDGLRMLFVAQLADFEGKILCQAFFRGDDPNVVREEITLDGVRRTDLESTYHLREGSTGLTLRPQVPAEDPTNTRTAL